jgi:hypothetical protein
MVILWEHDTADSVIGEGAAFHAAYINNVAALHIYLAALKEIKKGQVFLCRLSERLLASHSKHKETKNYPDTMYCTLLPYCQVPVDRIKRC